ncbi:MAG: hypothetical protein K8R40_11245 [Anaerolineaceae bacterium]|nr:hypothetical protein [Anaerolineaceae bacterium]
MRHNFLSLLLAASILVLVACASPHVEENDTPAVKEPVVESATDADTQSAIDFADAVLKARILL